MFGRFVRYGLRIAQVASTLCTLKVDMFCGKGGRSVVYGDWWCS